MDTLGHLLALHVSPANEGDHAEVAELFEAVQPSPPRPLRWPSSTKAALPRQSPRRRPNTASGWKVVKLPKAKRSFVLVPRRWVVELPFGWTVCFRRLVRDYERLPGTVRGLHQTDRPGARPMQPLAFYFHTRNIFEKKCNSI